MKKTLGFMATLILLGGLLAACSKDNGNDMKNSPSPSMESPAAAMNTDDMMKTDDMTKEVK
jgi:predicted small secreted protein